MIRRSSRVVPLLALAIAWLMCSSFVDGAPPQSKTEIVVSAAISLKDSLDEIAQLYRARHAEVTIHFNLGGSGTLQRQVEQGAPVDVFISASPDQMDALESKGLILAGSRKDMVKNGVVLIVPKDKEGIASFEDLAKPDAKTIAVGEPQTVPAGKYAQQVLMHFGLYDKVKSKLVLGKDVREVLAYVATGNADAGIVYVTDAKISQQVKIVATAPEDSHSPIIYPLAVIKDSKNIAAAKEFAEFLLSPTARDVFKKYGFQ